MHLPWQQELLGFDHVRGDQVLLFEAIISFTAFMTSINILIGDLSRFLH